MAFLNWLRAQWDRALAGLLAVLGVLLLLLGWVGVSGTGYVSRQLPYMISGGLGGVFLLAVSGTLLLSADLRDEWRELRAIRLRLDTMDATPAILTIAEAPRARAR